MSRKPVLVTAFGVLILSCMDAAMKSVSATYPLAEVVGLRYAAGALVSVSVFLAMGEGLPRRPALARNFLRAVVVLLTAATFFTAIGRLPLAEAVSLTFLAPFFTAALGYGLLGEPVSSHIKVGIVVGLIGVGVIAAGQGQGPGHAFDAIGIAAALFCAVFYALSNVLIRKTGGVDSSIVIVMLSNVFVCLLAAPAMVAMWQTPSTLHWAVFAGSGLLGTAGHLCLAWSYARAPAGVLGVLEYSAFIWATLLGFMMFGEVPSLFTTIGAGLIISACLFSTFRRAPQAAQTLTTPI